MLYITIEEYNKKISADGACYGDLLEFQNIDFEIIEEKAGL